MILRRRLASLWRPAALIGLALVFITLLGAGWARANGIALAAASQSLLAPLVHWPLQCALVIGIGSYVLVNARLQAVAKRLHNGWWAAIPIHPRSHAVVLCVIAASLCLLTLSLATVALLVLGADGDIGLATRGIALAVVLGAVVALVAVLRRPHAVTGFPHLRVRSRQPFFPTAWLQDRRLPHLSDWQRRRALLRWRTGASAMPACAVLMLLPVGASPLVLSGMLIFVLSAAWLGLVLRASIQIAASAGRLLRSTPAGPRRQLHAALRYPMFACACASTGGLLVAGMARSWTLLLGWAALVVLVTLPALPAAWRLFRNSRVPRR